MLQLYLSLTVRCLVYWTTTVRPSVKNWLLSELESRFGEPDKKQKATTTYKVGLKSYTPSADRQPKPESIAVQLHRYTNSQRINYGQAKQS